MNTDLAGGDVSSETPLITNTINGNGSLGITGWWKLAGNLTAMALIAGSFLFLQYTLISQNREDRADDRTMFREALKSIHDQQDRHVNEMKTTLEGHTNATKELTTEIRSWRRDQHARPPGGGDQ